MHLSCLSQMCVTESDTCNLNWDGCLFWQWVSGVGAGSDAASDRINNAMTASLLALFAGIVAVGASHGSSAHLAAVADWGAITPALPVMFLALVRCQN